MSKRPQGSVYVGNIYYYLIYCLAPFPRSLEVDLQVRGIFQILTQLMLHQKIHFFLGVVVFIHSAPAWQGSGAGTVAHQIED